MDLNKQGIVLTLKLNGCGWDDMEIQVVACCEDKHLRAWSCKLAANLYLEDYIMSTLRLWFQVTLLINIYGVQV